MPIIPASIRNNNPGAMYPGQSSKKFGSKSYETLRSKDGVHKIATFSTPVHGAAAQFDLLHNSYTGLSIENAIKKWCGGFYAGTYLKVLEDAGGVTRSTLLTKDMVKTPSIALPLAKAMALQEAGRPFPLSDEEWATAHEMAFSGATAPAYAPDNDVPSPKPKTRFRTAAKKVLPYLGVGTVAGGGATQAPVVVPTLPAPPDLSWLSGWQAFADQFAGLSGWITANPIIAALCALWVAAMTFLPQLLERLPWLQSSPSSSPPLDASLPEVPAS